MRFEGIKRSENINHIAHPHTHALPKVCEPQSCSCSSVMKQDLRLAWSIPQSSFSAPYHVVLDLVISCRCTAPTHRARPAPSPVHLYSASTSRRRCCCSPKSSGRRPLTCASAERMTLRKFLCWMSQYDLLWKHDGMCVFLT